ncbi:MAG: ABC transporter permease subunit [Planctomycetes bacterium]|nr:ABC transporter permease subunit [Planctomycetota bacterium]
MSPRVEQLWRRRPRDRFVRWSFGFIVLLVSVAWIAGRFSLADLFGERRARNWDRFLAEIRPAPLVGRDWDWGTFLDWGATIMRDRGLDAALSTLAISILAIVLAACLGAVLSLGAARNFATADPFGCVGRISTGSKWFWRFVYLGTRVGLIVMRALPEYLLAFVLLLIFGVNGWPVVLALAIHNAGILGRLDSETIENADPTPLRALCAAGAGRRQMAVVALWPTVFGRGLLYVFYRWETCVREATVLGMLGVVSLGYWIDDARTRDRYDEFVFLIGLGVVIVLFGDLISALARRLVR